MKNVCTLGILLSVMILACKSQQYNPDNYEARQIRFGSGGGFTGFVTTYFLLENGALYMLGPNETEYKYLSKVSKKTARSLFESVESGGLLNADINQPGNMYQFLEFHFGDEATRCVWDAAQNETESEHQTLYQTLMALTQPKP